MTQRLIQRNQPELANPDMFNWLKYLKRQAIQKNALILDTSNTNVADLAAIFIKNAIS